VRVCRASKSFISFRPVSHVVGMCSFDKMARIDTISYVASMSCFRERPSSMSQKECESMSKYFQAVVSAFSIPVFVQGKRPKNTFVGQRFFKLSSEPTGLSFAKMNCHLRSFTARVLRWGCLQEHPTFLLYQRGLSI
jgi:hypothetical protein